MAPGDAHPYLVLFCLSKNIPKKHPTPPESRRGWMLVGPNGGLGGLVSLFEKLAQLLFKLLLQELEGEVIQGTAVNDQARPKTGVIMRQTLSLCKHKHELIFMTMYGLQVRVFQRRISL